MPRSSVAKSAQTRRDILLRATDLASVEGLEGLTIGRLAGAISMSKSGLFAHFGSKEELQLAVVEAAREIFEREVMATAGGAGAGLQRLAAVVSAWLGYVEKSPFRGGCFFSAVGAEVDDRPGRLRDRVLALTTSWLGFLEAEAGEAVLLGQIETSSDPGQLVFELHAFIQEANRTFQLHGDPQAFGRARSAIQRTLASAATDDGRALLDSPH